MRIWIGVPAFALIVSTFLSCGDSDDPPGEVAATIGGETIPMAEVDRALVIKHGGVKASRGFGPPSYGACLDAKREAGVASHSARLRECKLENRIERAQVLASLVRAEWIRREAARRRIKVPVSFAKTRLEEQQRESLLDDTAFTRALNETGMTKREATDLIVVSELERRILADIDISATDVRAYYTDHKDEFSHPAHRIIRALFTSSHRHAVRAREALAHGDSWDQVDRRFSDPKTTDNESGQRLAVFKGQTSDPAFEHMIFSAKPMLVTGPERVQAGWAIIQVVRIRPVMVAPFRRVREEIEQTLRTRARDRALQRHFGAKTKCAEPFRIAEAPVCLAPQTKEG